jgi:hypothetical protein
VRATLRGKRAELFLSFHPLHEAARDRAERVDLGDGRSVAVLSAEDLALFKAVYGRPKDFVDIDQMLVIQGDDFDRSYVRSWIGRLLEADDPRRVELERLLASSPPRH